MEVVFGAAKELVLLPGRRSREMLGVEATHRSRPTTAAAKARAVSDDPESDDQSQTTRVRRSLSDDQSQTIIVRRSLSDDPENEQLCYEGKPNRGPSKHLASTSGALTLTDGYVSTRCPSAIG
jgi:hypothetical protein